MPRTLSLLNDSGDNREWHTCGAFTVRLPRMSRYPSSFATSAFWHSKSPMMPSQLLDTTHDHEGKANQLVHPTG